MIIGENFIFVRNPKAASSSIASFLPGVRGGKHYTLMQKSEWSDKRWRFAIVRNPWDRMVSAHKYWRNRRSNQEESLEEWLLGNPQMVTRTHFDIKRTPQIVWTWNCNMIGRFEQLESDVNDFLRNIGMAERKLPVLNTTQRDRDYRGYYTDRAAEIVADRFKVDIDRWGYEF